MQDRTRTPTRRQRREQQQHHQRRGSIKAGAANASSSSVLSESFSSRRRLRGPSAEASRVPKTVHVQDVRHPNSGEDGGPHTVSLLPSACNAGTALSQVKANAASIRSVRMACRLVRQSPDGTWERVVIADELRKSRLRLDILVYCTARWSHALNPNCPNQVMVRSCGFSSKRMAPIACFCPSTPQWTAQCRP